MSSGRDKFRKTKFFINILVGILKVLPRAILIFLWDLFTNYRQILFVGLRYIILKILIKDCGDNVKIGSNVQILGWENLTIGNNVSIHANCYIDANGTIKIGDNVSIAHNTTLLSANHGWSDRSLPIKYNPVSFAPLSIDCDVWVGCGCRILSGVTLGKRSIVAAGAVVNKSVTPGVIVGGKPARIIKEI